MSSSSGTLLATVTHQELHLVVNPNKSELRGWTTITAIVPPDGSSAVGLHSLGHVIHDVLVNGIPTDHRLVPGPEPGLSAAAGEAGTTVRGLAEQAYYDHLSNVQHEFLPNLIIPLPEGWNKKEEVVKQEAQMDQKQTLALEAAPAHQQQQHEGAVNGSHAAALDGNAAPANADASLGGNALQPGSDGNAGRTGVADPIATAAVSTEEGAPAPKDPAKVVVKKGPKGSKGAGGEAGANQPAAPPPQTMTIKIFFSKKLSATTTAAIMLIPAEDRCDSCEHPSADVGGASNRYMVCDTQLRRSRAIFPCSDVPGYVANFDVHITVPVEHTAVCDGLLKGQVINFVATPSGAQVPNSRTFHFQSEVPVAIGSLLMATGPMAVQPLAPGSITHIPQGPPGTSKSKAMAVVQDTSHCNITLLGPPDRMTEVAFTARALHLVIRQYETHLAFRYPFKQLHVAFLPAAALRALQPPILVGTNIVLASTSLLCGPDACESAVETTLLLAKAVASCMFGGLILPAAPEDAWLLEGLAMHLHDVWLAAWLGKNELAWRRHKEKEALVKADNGGVPPLCCRTIARTGIASMVAGTGAAAAAADNTPSHTPQLPLSSARAFGCPFGSELLEPGHLRRWKSSAVIRMLEKKTGSDQFRRFLGFMVSLASSRAQHHKFRHIATDKFLRIQIGKKLVVKGIDAFAQRWIYGRGCPEFQLGAVYKKTSMVDLALRQSGSAMSRRAAVLAVRAAKVAASEDDTQLHVKVQVNEPDVTNEVVIAVTPNDTLVMTSYEPVNKVAIKKPQQRKGKKDKEDEALPKEDGLDSNAVTAVPTIWIRVDPGSEWLAKCQVYQGYNAWVAQLRSSRDVVAQSQAVQGIVDWTLSRETLDPEHHQEAMSQALGVLESCMRSPAVYCRVRAEAALAIGLAIPSFVALEKLGGYLHECLRDPDSLTICPNNFSDLEHHVVVSALVVAVALLRDNMVSPHGAVDMLLDYLEHCDNSGNPYSDAEFICCILEGIGHLLPGNPRQLERILTALDRQLALEDLSPSPDYVIGGACLAALANLARKSLSDMAEQIKEGVVDILRKYAGLGVPLPLRHAAAKHLIALKALSVYDSKGTALLEVLFELYHQPGWGASGRTTLLLNAFDILGDVLVGEPASKSESDEADLDALIAVSPELGTALYQLMASCRHDARERQAAFMLLQRLARQDPTLYREREEELTDAVAAAQPEVTTVKSGGQGVTAAHPTKSGGQPARSGEQPTKSAGTMMNKAKSGGGVLGVGVTRSAMPAASGGTAGTVGQVGGTAAAARAAAGNVPRSTIKLKVPQKAAAAAATASGGTTGAVTGGGVPRPTASQGVSIGRTIEDHPPGSPTRSRQVSVGYPRPTVSFGPNPSGLPKSRLQPIPEGSGPAESGRTATVIGGNAADGDEVVQPVKVKVKSILKREGTPPPAGAEGGQKSPPRDPRRTSASGVDTTPQGGKPPPAGQRGTTPPPAAAGTKPAANHLAQSQSKALPVAEGSSAQVVVKARPTPPPAGGPAAGNGVVRAAQVAGGLVGTARPAGAQAPGSVHDGNGGAKVDPITTSSQEPSTAAAATGAAAATAKPAGKLQFGKRRGTTPTPGGPPLTSSGSGGPPPNHKSASPPEVPPPHDAGQGVSTQQQAMRGMSHGPPRHQGTPPPSTVGAVTAAAAVGSGTGGVPGGGAAAGSRGPPPHRTSLPGNAPPGSTVNAAALGRPQPGPPSTSNLQLVPAASAQPITVTGAGSVGAGGVAVDGLNRGLKRKSMTSGGGVSGPPIHGATGAALTSVSGPTSVQQAAAAGPAGTRPVRISTGNAAGAPPLGQAALPPSSQVPPSLPKPGSTSHLPPTASHGALQPPQLPSHRSIPLPQQPSSHLPTQPSTTSTGAAFAPTASTGLPTVVSAGASTGPAPTGGTKFKLKIKAAAGGSGGGAAPTASAASQQQAYPLQPQGSAVQAQPSTSYHQAPGVPPLANRMSGGQVTAAYPGTQQAYASGYQPETMPGSLQQTPSGSGQPYPNPSTAAPRTGVLKLKIKGAGTAGAAVNAVPGTGPMSGGGGAGVSVAGYHQFPQQHPSSYPPVMGAPGHGDMQNPYPGDMQQQQYLDPSLPPYDVAQPRKKARNM